MTQTIQALDFSAIPLPAEARAAMARERDPELWLPENKPKNFNRTAAGWIAPAAET